MPKFNYDNKFDVLYILFSNSKNSLGDEEYDGLVVMRDEITNEITGLTIFGFIEKYQIGSLPELPNEVDIDFDRIPLVSLKSAV